MRKEGIGEWRFGVGEGMHSGRGGRFNRLFGMGGLKVFGCMGWDDTKALNAAYIVSGVWRLALLDIRAPEPLGYRSSQRPIRYTSAPADISTCLLYTSDAADGG